MRIGNRSNMVITNARLKRQTRIRSLSTRTSAGKIQAGGFKSRTNKSLLETLNKTNSSETNLQTLVNNQNKSYAYGIVETAAERVRGSLSSLAESGDASFWEKDADGTAAEKEVQSFVSNYNIMLRKMSGIGGSVNQAYEKKLKDLITAKKAELRNFGITQNADGTLEFDEKTFRKADRKAVENFFSGDSGMAQRILTQTKQVEQYAAEQIATLKKNSYTPSSNYSRYGSSTGNGASGYWYNARG